MAKKSQIKRRGLPEPFIQRRVVNHNVRFIVRWPEDRGNGTKEQSKSFTDRAEAVKFESLCRLKLGIVGLAKSCMDKEMLPAGDLVAVIDEYVAEVAAAQKETSSHAKQLYGYLKNLPALFKWKVTSDIQSDACERIAAQFHGRTSYTIRATQISLKCLVRAMRLRYAFAEGILFGKLKRHVKKKYYIWTDEEKDLIFAELSRPLSYSSKTMSGTEWQRGRARRRELEYAEICHALLPVVWVQMLWGLRPLESCLVRVDYWDSRKRELCLPAKITKSGVERRFTVDRITAAILDLLTKDRDHTDFLFRTAHGKPWEPKLMSRQFRSVLKRLRLRGSLYSCRHYAVTTLLEVMPGKLRSVMAISGHASLETIDPYVGLKGDRQHPAAAAYDNLYEVILRRAARPAMPIPPEPPQSHPAASGPNPESTVGGTRRSSNHELPDPIVDFVVEEP